MVQLPPSWLLVDIHTCKRAEPVLVKNQEAGCYSSWENYILAHKTSSTTWINHHLKTRDIDEIMRGRRVWAI